MIEKFWNFIRNENNNDLLVETIKDNKIEGSVVITKENETGTPLAGAKIEIINSANKVVYTGVTNSKGEITDANLPYGTYTYREIAAPNKFAYTNNSISPSVMHGITTRPKIL